MQQLQFHPARMREQAGRLEEMAAGVSRALEDLRGIPGPLGSQLGDNALPQALTHLLRQGEEEARALRRLAQALEQSAGFYEGAERTLNDLAGQLPGVSGAGGGGAGDSQPVRLHFPTGPVQFGDFYVDSWLARLVLEEEQEGLPHSPGTSG